MRLDAIAEAELYAVPDCTPVITAEFYKIVTRHKRASIHATSTAYVYGDVVQLSTRNGHRYRCIEGGTSAGTEPTFPLCDSSTIVDGTVTWIEAGPDYSNVYDVRAICHDAWILKATKSSNLVTTSFGNSKVEASHLAEACKARARDFAPLEMA